MTSRRRILVADGDEAIREQARLTLAGSAYDVVEAAETEGAIQHIATLLPDLVLVDLALPEAGGLRLTRSLKAQPETREAIVVLLHDRAEPLDEDDVWGAGVDELLAKPFTSLGLLAKVDGLLAGTVPGVQSPDTPDPDSP